MNVYLFVLYQNNLLFGFVKFFDGEFFSPTEHSDT